MCSIAILGVLGSFPEMLPETVAALTDFQLIRSNLFQEADFPAGRCSQYKARGSRV